MIVRAQFRRGESNSDVVATTENVLIAAILLAHNCASESDDGYAKIELGMVNERRDDREASVLSQARLGKGSEGSGDERRTLR